MKRKKKRIYLCKVNIFIENGKQQVRNVSPWISQELRI